MSTDTWRGWKAPRPYVPPKERKIAGLTLNRSDFGTLLKSLREKRGVSQSKLAEKAEFDHSYVSRLEAGNRIPTKEAVNRLADALALTDGERDSLLASAGFLPRDVTSLLTSEPTIAMALDVLTDPALTQERKERLRDLLRAAVAMATDARAL